jgi:hypothetical protein
MKDCFKCGENKPLSAFYRHARMGDGHLNKCKQCTKKDVSGNYRANRDYYAEYDKIRNATSERKFRIVSNTKSWRKANPMKSVAHRAVSAAIRNGSLKRLPCQNCGETAHVHGHHDDYSKPLDVMWLCARCHSARHAHLKSMELN